MRNHTYAMTTGIARTPEFERKGLACYAINVGTKCGHNCTYCSTGAMLRMHPSFKKYGESPFDRGYSIVDPDTPERVAQDAERIRKRGLIQMCTIVDAYAPEAQRYQIGRRCLDAILSQPDWSVRILTKNAAVAKDFDLILKHRDRVLLGLSLTGTSEKADIIQAIEPNASPISDRVAALRKAHRLGLRTYGMLCPLLPGIADSLDDVGQLVRTVIDSGAEEIFVEPVNTRGKSLTLTQEVLTSHGYSAEAAAIAAIRNRAGWSRYVVSLLRNVQIGVREHSDIQKLRFLLYPSRLLPEDLATIRADDAGVVWLGKDKRTASSSEEE